jgi:DHA1 family inner membrane transport protein
MPLALLALALGTFGIGTTEFGMIGVLPEVAKGFGVSVPTAGLLVTSYALGVMIGAPVMTLLGTRLSRKHMLTLLMLLFVAGSLISALAPAFGVMWPAAWWPPAPMAHSSASARSSPLTWSRRRRRPAPSR